jgi:predicted nucleic acid-binding protein
MIEKIDDKEGKDFFLLVHFPIGPCHESVSERQAQRRHVLELAVEARCDFIVTHNVRDFSASERFGVRVVTPRAFLRAIGGMP